MTPRSLPTAVAILLSLPIAGCQRSVSEDDVLNPPTAEPPRIDLRPETGLRTVGDDITELVRAQNAKGKEPPLPTRTGTSARTSLRPRIVRNGDGYVAHLPGARDVPSPAHHRGRIFVGGYGTYQLHAIDAESGRPDWSVRLSDDGPTEPACEDDICVFNTFSCTLYAVDASSGRQLWSWYLGSPQLATPVLAGGAVYSSYPDSNGPPEARFVIARFDFKTGKPGWRRWIDAEVHSTPVAHGGRIYLATKAGTFYEFDADDGAVISAYRNRIASPPVVAEQRVLFARDEIVAENDMIAIARPIFPELESAPASKRDITARPRPLIADHRLVTVDRGVVVATHLETGRRLWQRRLGDEEPAAVGAPMILAGDSILVATTAGNVLRVEADSGEISRSYALGAGPLASPPIAVDGWLYAGTKNGSMVAHDTGAPELTGWDMLGGSPDRQGARRPEGT